MTCPGLALARPVCIRPAPILRGCRSRAPTRPSHLPRAQRAGGEPDDIEAQRAALNRMMGYQPSESTSSRGGASATLTGKELRDLVYKKWGKSYDVRLIARNGRMYLHVMWKYLEQQSFPLTGDQYQEQLDAIAELCSIWGVGQVVREGIAASDSRPPHVTRGTGKAVQIILGDNLSLLETGS